MRTKKEVLLSSLGSFIATVLGIAITLGASKVVDHKRAKNLQKQSVYCVLNDLENMQKQLRRDSIMCATYNWLPSYMRRYSSGEGYPVDSAFTYFYTGGSIAKFLVPRYSSVGETIVNNIVPSDIHDMELHRLIGLAYQVMDKALVLQNSYLTSLDDIRRVQVTLETSKEMYSKTVEDFIDYLFECDPVRQFAVDIDIINVNDSFGGLIGEIDSYHDRILYFAGLTEQDYQKFKDDATVRPKKENE